MAEIRASGSAPQVLLSGSRPGGLSGGAVGSDVLLRALARFADVTLVEHHSAASLSWHETTRDGLRSISLATQPVSVHGEAVLSGLRHRKRLREWRCGWAVLSRHAGALYAAGVPYIVWEATTARNELTASSLRDVRQSRRGTGIGYGLHRMLLPLDEALEGRMYRRAAAVLAMSDHTRNEIIATHRLPPERVELLALPPGPALLAALQELAPVHAAESPRTSNAPWRLLFVGRADDPRKNFSLLPAVLRRMHDLGRPASLTVIGTYNERWRASLSLNGIADAVRFAGPVSVRELASAYLQHDLLVVPSRQEGYGIIVGEAFAAGVPVVSTRCGGPEQMITASGAGELVSIDADEMAAAIIRVLGNPSQFEALRQRAKTYADGPLSFGRFADEVERITRVVLQAH